MKYLLDTHTFLWFIAGDKRLSRKARTYIEDMNNEILLSIASLWEIAIKFSLGKLELSKPYATFIPAQLEELEIQTLPIAFEHFVTADPDFHEYPVTVIE